MRSGSSETKFLQELVLYVASAALSCLVLFAGIRHLVLNREESKKAIKHKKDIAKRLGRPLIQTNPHEAFPRDSPLAVDLSTAILSLSENGDLQRIHDKWLTKSACSSENTEIETDLLELKSFRGLYLICGIACIIALLIYFVQIVRKYKKSVAAESISDRQGTRHSRYLWTILSLMHENKDQSRSDAKRRKMDRSFSDYDEENDLGRDSKKRELQISSEHASI